MKRDVSWRPQQVREARTQPLGVLPLTWWALQSQALLKQSIPILTPKIDEYLNQELEYVLESC